MTPKSHPKRKSTQKEENNEEKQKQEERNKKRRRGKSFFFLSLSSTKVNNKTHNKNITKAHKTHKNNTHSTSHPNWGEDNIPTIKSESREA